MRRKHIASIDMARPPHYPKVKAYFNLKIFTIKTHKFNQCKYRKDAYENALNYAHNVKNRHGYTHYSKMKAYGNLKMFTVKPTNLIQANTERA